MQLSGILNIFSLFTAFAVCGGNYAGAQSGNLSTPNYPLNYPDSSNCVWIIHCPYYHYVTVSLPKVSIEFDKTCAFDYLVFFDGPSTDGSTLNPQTSGVDLKKPRVCGEGSDLHWKSSGHSITAKFVSDDSTSAKGFTGTWRCVPKSCKYLRLLKVKAVSFQIYPIFALLLITRLNHSCSVLCSLS